MREEEGELTLTPEECDVFAGLESKDHGQWMVPAKPKRVRALILRQIILGRKVKWNGYTKAEVIEIPPKGLRLRNLEITGDLGTTDFYDQSAILNLIGACTPKGDSLPPVEFRECTFHQKVIITGARFRFLSFKDSKLTRLQATDLHVDGSLVLTGISSSQQLPIEAIPVGDNGELIRGASSLVDNPFVDAQHESEGWLPNDNMRKLDPSVKRKLDCILSSAQPEALCWVQLRNANIGFDLDMRHAKLVAPAENRDDLSLTNSPMSSYALDLRGATIEGRLAFNPDPHTRASEHFRALGGVSIVRATIGGSVCASGAELIAVEGSAFAAERATIRGHLFLDFSWEGQQEWKNFTAYGFVDLTNTVIGSSLYMGGALLKHDRWRRAGLVATGVTVGNLCELCAVDNLGDPDEAPQCARFCSSGGVRLDNAVIHGNLNMSGACLHADSFRYAMYASGITVHGTADLMYFHSKNKGGEGAPFTAKAPIVLVSGQFHKTLRFRGAQLDLEEVKRTNPATDLSFAAAPEPEEDSQNRDALASDAAHDCCILADLINIQSSFYLSPARRSSPREAVRTVIEGSVSMRRAFVGMNLHAEGTSVSTVIKGNNTSAYNSGVAFDLSGTRVQGSVRLRSYVPEEQKGEKGSPLLFELRGTLKLQEMNIGDQLHLVGADVRYISSDAKDSKKAHGERGLAIEASGIDVKSYVYFGEFRSMRAENEVELCNSSSHDMPLHKILRTAGSVNLSRSLLQAGLFLTDSVISSLNQDIEAYFRETPQALDAEKRNVGLPLTEDKQPQTLEGRTMYSLNTSTADINLLRILNCTFVGTVKSFDLTARHGVRTKHMTVKGGGIDLWKSSLGFLELSDLKLIYPKEIDPLDTNQPDVLHLGQTKVDGGLTIECRVTPRPSEPRTFYANLRGLEVGSLDDGRNAEGWGTDICLKLVGFVCHRAPTKRKRDPDVPWYQRWNPYSYPADTPDTKWLKRENPAAKQAQRSWFVTWWMSICDLFKSGQETSKPQFTPSAYDQLAKVLREDGNERDSRVVLIEKWKQKTRYSSRRHLKIILAIFGRFFHFGFSTAPALATMALGLILGAAIFCCGAYDGAVLDKDATTTAMARATTNSRNAQSEAFRDLAVTTEKDILASDLRNAYTQSYSHSGRMTGEELETLIDELHISSAAHKRAGILALKQAMDSPDEFSCLVRAPDGSTQHSVGHILESYGNSFIYASGEFIPLFHFDDTKRCKIKESSLGWQAFHLVYAAAGWIVTSLTLLTVPGILRRRENG